MLESQKKGEGRRAKWKMRLEKRILFLFNSSHTYWHRQSDRERYPWGREGAPALENRASELLLLNPCHGRSGPQPTDLPLHDKQRKTGKRNQNTREKNQNGRMHLSWRKCFTQHKVNATYSSCATTSVRQRENPPADHTRGEKPRAATPGERDSFLSSRVQAGPGWCPRRVVLLLKQQQHFQARCSGCFGGVWPTEILHRGERYTQPGAGPYANAQPKLRCERPFGIVPSAASTQTSNAELAVGREKHFWDRWFVTADMPQFVLQKKRCPLKELLPRENSVSDIIRFNDGAILKLKLYISIMWLKLPKLAYYLNNTQDNKWATTNQSILLDINCHQGFWMK